MRMVVVLPAPLGPRKPNTSPRQTARSRWSTASSLPKRLVSPCVASTTGRSSQTGSGEGAPVEGGSLAPPETGAPAPSCSAPGAWSSPVIPGYCRVPAICVRSLQGTKPATITRTSPWRNVTAEPSEVCSLMAGMPLTVVLPIVESRAELLLSLGVLTRGRP